MDLLPHGQEIRIPGGRGCLHSTLRESVPAGYFPPCRQATTSPRTHRASPILAAIGGRWDTPGMLTGVHAVSATPGWLPCSSTDPNDDPKRDLFQGTKSFVDQNSKYLKKT